MKEIIFNFHSSFFFIVVQVIPSDIRNIEYINSRVIGVHRCAVKHVYEYYLQKGHWNILSSSIII